MIKIVGIVTENVSIEVGSCEKSFDKTAECGLDVGEGKCKDVIRKYAEVPQ